MSSDLFLTQPHLLACHRRQVVLLVVRDVTFPHHEDDLQPFRAQRPERLAMRVSPRALLILVRSGPRTREQREERYLINDVPQRLVAAKRNWTTRCCLPLRLVTGTVPACACRCRNDSQRPGASPRRAQSVGAVMPCFPIGGVRVHCAAGMRAKKSSIAVRY
jgi:hypothetical protein